MFAGCFVLSSNKNCLALRDTVISIMKTAVINSHWLNSILVSTRLVEIAINLEVLSEWLLCDCCLISSLQMPENNFGIPIKEKATFHLENF